MAKHRGAQNAEPVVLGDEDEFHQWYTCQECGRRFYAYKGWDVEMVEKVGKMVCLECGNTIGYEQAKAVHADCDARLEKYVCVKCGQEFEDTPEVVEYRGGMCYPCRLQRAREIVRRIKADGVDVTIEEQERRWRREIKPLAPAAVDDGEDEMPF